MDAVELARRRAAELHYQAVQQGLDPWKPYEFVIAIAKQQGYDAEYTLPGASILDGGRAKLLPSGELILHERKGTLFEQALLVAHEIGHALLGDADDATPCGRKTNRAATITCACHRYDTTGDRRGTTTR